MAMLLDKLDCSPVVVLGFSDGAEVSLLLAAMRPDLVRGICSWGVCGVISAEELEAVENWLPVSEWGSEREAWLSGVHTSNPLPGLYLRLIRIVYNSVLRGGIRDTKPPERKC